ncbi:FadR family transcriptional regulator [Priestia filamentosa]|uniref:FadR/GntR family transcriptional regulator n=1 Tax=Priestia filamentosa TaxID=1402861 RepID=UPI001FB291E0|nr:FadR/GntR family transcriptional regulator [Priestia filamentosa]MED3729120.1 FadR/GntR family transcriptional regulator [Priestia filamentosa]UOE59012.1 FadR family transcriptional regulator [Priestia filamentosa]
MTGPMKKVSFKSVNRNTLAKQVVDRIIELLISGQLKPGDKLPTEMELLDVLHVSRPVLREALSALEILGVITRKTRDGTYFNNKVGTQPFSVMLALAVDNLPAIVEARMTLELGLVTMAAEKITDEQLQQLKKTIESIENSKDYNYGEFDKEFHRIIATSADNQIVEGMIHSLLLTHEKTDNEITFREPKLTAQHHTAIYNALCNHDPIDAFQQMYNHLKYVRDKVLKSYNPPQ